MAKRKPMSLWRQVKEQIVDYGYSYFSVSPVIAKTGSWAIVGRPGTGKTIFLLWAIDKILADKSDHPLRRVIFLSPSQYPHWIRSVEHYDPATTLLVVDAPFRLRDTHGTREEKARWIDRISGGFITSSGRNVPPFRVLLTLREDEFDDLLVRLPEGRLQRIPTDWQRVPIWPVLLRHAKIQGIKVDIDVAQLKDAQDVFYKKSDGLPLYCQLLAAHLRERRRKLTLSTIAEFPTGFTNLILHVLEKVTQPESLEPILSLLLLMADLEQPLSDAFFDHAIESDGNEKLRRTVRKSWETLKNHYLSVLKPVTAFRYYALDPHWASALKEMMKPNSLLEMGTDDRYQSARNSLIRCWQMLPKWKCRISDSIMKSLSSGLDDNWKVILCVDLARLGDDSLHHATQLWKTSKASANLEVVCQFARKQIYDCHLDRAYEMAAQREKRTRDARAWFKSAFDIHAEPQDVQSYINFLRRYAIETCQTEDETQEQRKEILAAYNRLFTLNQRDRIAWSSRAHFWQEIGEFEKADNDYRHALDIQADDTFERLSAVQAYAVFLANRWDVLWTTRPEEAERKLNQAEQLLEEGLDQLKNPLTPDEVAMKVAFLNAYSVTRLKQAKKEFDPEERARLDQEAVGFLREALRIDPDHTHSVNTLANLLMRYGWFLPEYAGKKGQPLRDAQTLLEKRLQEQGEERDPTTLHILGRLLYLPLPGGQRNFQVAAGYLLESAKRGRPSQKLIANHELGKLYIEWAQEGKNRGRPDEDRLRRAEEFLTLAVRVPESPVNYWHLATAYTSLARLSLLRGQPEVARTYFGKLQKLTLLVKALSQFISKSVDEVLTEIGDDLAVDENWDGAIWCFQEALTLNDRPWYVHARLAYFSSRLGRIVETLKFYQDASRRAHTAKASASIRNGINEARHYLRLPPYMRRSFQEVMLENSRKAYDSSRNYWKNAIDYGEDLQNSGEDRDTIEVVKSAVVLCASAIRKAKRTTRGLKWAKMNVRWMRSRLKFILGNAYFKLGQVDSARKYLWRSAYVQNSERGWFEYAVFEGDKIRARNSLVDEGRASASGQADHYIAVFIDT